MGRRPQCEGELQLLRTASVLKCNVPHGARPVSSALPRATTHLPSRGTPCHPFKSVSSHYLREAAAKAESTFFAPGNTVKLTLATPLAHAGKEGKGKESKVTWTRENEHESGWQKHPETSKDGSGCALNW